MGGWCIYSYKSGVTIEYVDGDGIAWESFEVETIGM